ncbi:hypothetical protein JCM10449v2_006279 [Rhodotorula kratochvilovae]
MTAPVKNVVLVGLGPAAVPAAQALAASLPKDYRLVAIAGSEGYWPIAALRAAVVPGWEDKPVAPVDAVFPASERSVLLKNTNVVELKEHSVVVDKAHPELGKEIPFEFCILATGSNYPYPCRPRPGRTVAEAIADLRETQQQVASASSILIVGGGPVGVELAGEIGEHYDGSSGRAEKEVTLVHSHDKFLHEQGWKDKFNGALKTQVEALGVKVVLGRKAVDAPHESGPVEGGKRAFHLDNGETVEADFVFVTHGNAPNTGFVGAFDPEALNAKKQVKVRPSFQLEKYDHIFAIGDITSVEEAKMVAMAKNHGPIAVANILSLIQAGGTAEAYPTVKHKAYKPGPQMMLVSVGSKGGAGQLFGWTVGSWFSWLVKARTLFVGDFKKMYGAA